ncbi:NTP transferase domain-containing protein [Panacibacter sp. DH6]|uniref:Probable molybdenum cofactor guanylyltransferase n=1 Tax=Panacibacter microcysteis TaxID=2793269 RepID=A0A931H003_9BACT|nr:NTP transferase domain-containing protein [Panacibacter microcysteis]MBG9378475.1 NTP transferase domain-containing protein [Panacibacter microcysteis]
MISKDHKKHAAIARPAIGNFNRNEYAVLGTTCANVQALCNTIIKALSAKYKCAYADADHKDKIAALQSQQSFIEYTDKISYKEFRYQQEPDKFQLRQLFNDADLVLVNGNHYEAAKQIVVIDKMKEASLLKRVSQLSNVQLILLHENADGIFDFIKEAVPHWQQLPLLALKEAQNITEFFEKQQEKNKPLLKGLVLAGGRSERMGFDKTVIAWHGKEQRTYMADLMRPVCNSVFISCRQEQVENVNSYPAIADSFTGLGPFGAILSAFREDPDAAWLVVASDLPLLDSDMLNYLVQYRDASKVATTFESPHDGFPEPLITIWEPKAYPLLLSFLGQGYSCPRKVLRNADIKMIKAPQPLKLMNVNTEAELLEAKKVMDNKTALT